MHYTHPTTTRHPRPTPQWTPAEEAAWCRRKADAKDREADALETADVSRPEYGSSSREFAQFYGAGRHRYAAITELRADARRLRERAVRAERKALAVRA